MDDRESVLLLLYSKYLIWQSMLKVEKISEFFKQRLITRCSDFGMVLLVLVMRMDGLLRHIRIHLDMNGLFQHHNQDYIEEMELILQ